MTNNIIKYFYWIENNHSRDLAFHIIAKTGPFLDWFFRHRPRDVDDALWAFHMIHKAMDPSPSDLESRPST